MFEAILPQVFRAFKLVRKMQLFLPHIAMSTEQKTENVQAKPAFNPWAALFGVIILLGGAWTMSFVFKSSRPLDLWRYVVESALFLFTGSTWVYAAFTGRWGLRK